MKTHIDVSNKMDRIEPLCGAATGRGDCFVYADTQTRESTAWAASVATCVECKAKAQEILNTLPGGIENDSEG